MAGKKNKQQGISPAGKVAILCAVFGVPLLFFLSSWGLSKLYDAVPYAVVIVLLIAETIYSAYICGLLYKYYQASPPILRFVPIIGEVSLVDVKFRAPCYIGYLLALVCFIIAMLPYSVLKVLGVTFATQGPFYMAFVSILILIIVQIILGRGLMGTMKDIAADWKKQVHADIGAVSKFIFFGFIPFVRVIALYSLDKPLSTMVSFMGVSSEDTEEDSGFEEEE